MQISPKTRNLVAFSAFISTIEPKNMKEAMMDADGVVEDSPKRRPSTKAVTQNLIGDAMKSNEDVLLARHAKKKKFHFPEPIKKIRTNYKFGKGSNSLLEYCKRHSPQIVEWRGVPSLEVDVNS
uniref:Uncharacterized protein n=1 Tax=Solanum lycopersicum TaxID=4081 RepID=A0A3Q7I7T1_SOLLC